MMPGAPGYPTYPVMPPIMPGMDIYKRLINLRCNHGTFLRADKNRSKIDLSSSNQSWEQWLIIPLEGGKVCLRSIWGTYLRAKKNGDIDQAEEQSEWEAWTLETISGKFAFRSHHGTYLRGNPKGHMDQAPHCKEWEQWDVLLK